MAYTIRNTQNQLVTTVADGAVDSTTNLRLIGKNYVGYGTALNENLIALLENFANSSAPTKPITGMLWYDIGSNDLKIYNGASFVPAIKSASTFAVTSNLSAGNISVSGVISSQTTISAITSMSAPTFNGNLSGNVSGNVTGNVSGNLSGNVTGNLNGNVSATTIAGNLTTAAQPNVTSLGSLVDLTVNGNTSLAATGGAVAIGAAVASTSIILDITAPSGPGIVQLKGTGLAAGRLTVDAGPDFNVINTSNGKLNLGSNNNTRLTIAANGFVGIGTSTPTNNLHVVGNIETSNVVATLLTGTLTTAAQPNITSLGTLSSVTVTANANVGNLNSSGDVSATSNVAAVNVNASTAMTAPRFVSNVATGTAPFTVNSTTQVANLNAATSGTAVTVTQAAQANITSVGTLTGLTVGGSTQINSLGVGTAASGTAGEIRATNNITAYYSDQRLKKDIKQIKGALDILNHIRGVRYVQSELAETFGYHNYDQQVGVIAQEVQKVVPEAVRIAPFDAGAGNTSISGENYLTVLYDRLVPVLIEAIKELQAEIEVLKGNK
jgi:hypothetical protein